MSTIPKQRNGSVIINTTGTTYAVFTTLADIRTMFNDNTIIAPNVTVSVTNGDFDANAKWIVGTAWQGNNLMLRFDSNATGAMRVNYEISISKNN